MNGKVNKFGVREHLAINANFLPTGIDAGSKFVDKLSIHLDATCADQFLTLTPAGNAGGGQDFLQSLTGFLLLALRLAFAAALSRVGGNCHLPRRPSGIRTLGPLAFTRLGGRLAVPRITAT